MRFLDVGEAGLLAETASQDAAHRVWRAIRNAQIPGVVDAVAGARTVLVTFDPLYDVRQRVRDVAVRAPAVESDSGRDIDIPVTYDGPDLDASAIQTGLSTVEVAHRHSERTYNVAFLGFSPGFAYLTGIDAALRLPRRETPRTAVPAGSVAIAGEYTAVYPQRTPGGWHVIGHTDLAVFDPDRDPPALLAPGDRVRFVRR